MARRKFKFIVSMQRYSKSNKEEHENAKFLLHAHPDSQIAYLMCQYFTNMWLSLSTDQDHQWFGVVVIEAF